MLRDLLIDREVFDKIRKKALESDEEENSTEEIDLLEKAVFKRLKKKRSGKKYKKIRPCQYIDPETNRWAIYASRPRVCRSYPLVLVESGGRTHNIINLRSSCNYSVQLILEKSIILFDEALRRLKQESKG